MDLTGPSKSSQLYTSMVLVQSVCLHYSPPIPPNLHGEPLGHCSACCIACFASESTLATSALMDFSFSSASSWHAELVVEGSRSNKWLGKDWRKSEGCHVRSDDVCEHAKCPGHLSITLWRLNPSNLLPERWKCTHPRKKSTELQKWVKAGGLEDDAPFRCGVTIGFHVRFRELLVSPSDVSKRTSVPDVPSPALVQLEGWV